MPRAHSTCLSPAKGGRDSRGIAWGFQLPGAPCMNSAGWPASRLSERRKGAARLGQPQPACELPISTFRSLRWPIRPPRGLLWLGGLAGFGSPILPLAPILPGGLLLHLPGRRRVRMILIPALLKILAALVRAFDRPFDGLLGLLGDFRAHPLKDLDVVCDAGLHSLKRPKPWLT